MRLRLTLTLLCALVAVSTAGPAGAHATIPDPSTDLNVINIGHPRAAVLTVYHSGAESFLLLGPTERDEPLRPGVTNGVFGLSADYEALFMPLTAGWARHKLEAWLLLDGGRRLLDEDSIEIVDFGPARRAGRLGLRLQLDPGLHQLQLVAVSQARAVGVPDWTTDRDTVTVWVYIPSGSAKPRPTARPRPTASPQPKPLGQEASDYASPASLGEVGDRLAPMGHIDPGPQPEPGIDPVLPIGGLSVGSQRGVLATEAVGALNFPTGHNRTVVVRVGETVRVWADYELWWADDAHGEAAAALIIRQRPSADEAGAAELARAHRTIDEGHGPRLEDGSLVATLSFERPGLYPLAATLSTGVRMDDKRAVDEDTVPFYVRVIETHPQGGAISGEVLSDDGLPLEGVKVEATDRRGHPVGEARTNADGRYLIEKLKPGEYFVHATPEDLNYLDEWWKDRPSIHGATPVTVKDGAVTKGINFRLTPGGTITGRVTNEAGDPLGGIEISAGFLRSADGTRDPSQPPVDQATIARTKTNDEGYYSIDRLRANAYWVRARDPEGRYLTEFFDDKPDFAHADKVWVKAGEVTKGIDFVLAPGGAIEGTVVEQSVTGQHMPLAGMLVQVFAPENPEHPIASAVTSRSGTYRIGGLRAGDYFARASDPKGRYLPEWWQEAASHEGAQPIKVVPGETTRDISFTLERAPHRTVVFIQPAHMGARVGGSGRLNVAVKGVENLGAFETSIAWNPEILQVDEVLMGDFLGRTGRRVLPMEPQIDNAAGTLHYGAASIGDQPGPAGQGVLFTIVFTAVAVGESGVEIDQSILTHPSAEAIEHDTQHGLVTVGECMFGDFDCNCVIDIRDVMEVVSRWGTSEGDLDYDPTFDLDDDGDIDIVDVQIETSLWGRRCDELTPEPGTPLGRRSPAAMLHGSAAGASQSVGQAIKLTAGPTMELTVQPALAEVGSTVTAYIDIVEAVDLAGFDFWLEYDAERLSFAGAELGEFLGSTSRSVFPLGPNVEDGRVGYGAFSLPGAPAPNGSGRIAVLQFEVTAPGVSTLDLGEATTVDSRQESSPAGGASTTIEGRGTAPEIDLFVPFATRR